MVSDFGQPWPVERGFQGFPPRRCTRQAEDESLRRMADRIQGRAIYRCGQLLKEIAKARNQHDAEKRAEVGDYPSRKPAAEEVGLSEYQQKTAIRVSNITEGQFNELIESGSADGLGPRRDREAFAAEAHRRPRRHRPRGLLRGHEAHGYAPQVHRGHRGAVDMRKALDGLKDFERPGVAFSVHACLDGINRLLTTIEEREAWQCTKK